MYSVKKPLKDSVYGSHGELMTALKYVILLLLFLFSFICHSLSIRFFNQVNFLINCAPDGGGGGAIAADYVADLLERVFVLSTVGNRLFYSAVPLLIRSSIP